ncbi:4-hydroxyphenylacetate decarboxylase activase [Sporolituus thermophilus]|uniref:Pyruvate formate lyase activating enzyme n=1 Tax=Sporolituus thermophilus DSM 23256 TaxID=1123285 RepID=A0A1G7JSP7_9FIRM|nr:4-hydroxyphenylacetate decarboxylase activase [Sporolituus thermophilus]SDF27958.1 pyruvate formate lyase activating enzyme [Sporolituus thermophilus DSM 23256]
MPNSKGLIFDIQSYSVHDGPGCRTLVFMMGCPLRCGWCANPEGWEARRRLMFRATKCVRPQRKCRRCAPVCPEQAVDGGEKHERIKINWDKCRHCASFACAAACLNEALTVCGREITVEELTRILNRDRHYWGSDGGVTFSGGEPLVQQDFLLAALKRCRESYIHTAIETSAYAPWPVFSDVMANIDFAFIDIKHMDPDQHKNKTGVSNELILNNIRALKANGWPGRLIIRMPVIADFNDSEDNINAMIAFFREIGQNEINILPFHRLGDSKWTQCGMVYPYRDYEATPEHVLDHIQELFLANDILCYVGHETPF